MIKIRIAIFPVQVIISYLLYFLLKYLIKYVLEYYTKHNTLLAVVLMLIRFARLIHYLYISTTNWISHTLLFSSAMFSSQIWGGTSLGETDFSKCGDLMWRRMAAPSTCAKHSTITCPVNSHSQLTVNPVEVNQGKVSDSTGIVQSPTPLIPTSLW